MSSQEKQKWAEQLDMLAREYNQAEQHYLLVINQTPIDKAEHRAATLALREAKERYERWCGGIA